MSREVFTGADAISPILRYPSVDMTSRTEPSSNTWIREELLHLLSVSGTMAGLSITGVALLHTAGKAAAPTTIVDDVFVLCSLLFLLCIYVIFWALRSRKPALAARLAELADVIFLSALTAMILAGLMMAYTLW